MAVGRKIVSIVTCTFFAHGLQVVCAQGAFGSDAIAGIVVACVAVLVIVIGGVVVYMVWRSRRRAAKNTNSAAAAAAQESAVEGGGGGHAHPADIPIEAVNRIPPPAYAHPTATTTTPRRPPPGSHHHRRSRQQNAGTTAPLDPPRPPPPYSPPLQGNAVDISCDEAPPEYRSRVGLNSSGGPDPRSRNDPQSVSVESFAEYPSMRNILLTSSRSSLQGTDSSRHASTQSDRSSSGGGGGGVGARAAAVSMSPAGRPSSPRSRGRRRGRDSAQGDSVYSRSISTSSSALNDPRVSVPEGGLQRKVRRSKEAATTGGALNRSCPSLVDEATAAGRIKPSLQQPHHRYDDDDDDHHHHPHRRRRTVSAEEERDGNPRSESTKRGRYHRGRTAQLSSSPEYSDDRRGYSTDSDLATGPRTDFDGRLRIAGTTVV